MFFRKSSATKQKAKILQQLQEFEEFCMGQKRLSPIDFRRLNRDLSFGAIMHIGSHHYQKTREGKHLIWVSPDDTEHDLGLEGQIDIMKECPGFHKKRTQTLGADDIADVNVLSSDVTGKSMTCVEMHDGTLGVAPNYNLALRNAALKMHLKAAFKSANPETSWLAPYGQC